jgi:hypothetical protein
MTNGLEKRSTRINVALHKLVADRDKELLMAHEMIGIEQQRFAKQDCSGAAGAAAKPRGNAECAQHGK